MEVRRKTFTVVARAASGAYFSPDGHFRVRQFPTRASKVDVLIRTRRAELDGFDRPVPRGLYAEVRGEAESIYEALQEFTTAAQNLMPLLSMSANAPIENLQPELAFESTPGVEEREYFQQFLLDERLLLQAQTGERPRDQGPDGRRRQPSGKGPPPAGERSILPCPPGVGPWTRDHGTGAHIHRHGGPNAGRAQDALVAIPN